MAQFTWTPPRSTSNDGDRAGAARHRRFRSLPNRDPVRERPGKATQSHLKAIYKAYTRHRLRSTEPPQSPPKATPKPPQSHIKATTKPHQSHIKATHMRPTSQVHARRKPCALVFPSCSLRILMVFSWYSPRISRWFLPRCHGGFTESLQRTSDRI